MNIEIIKEFDGGYGRIGIICIKKAICTICDKESSCLSMDGSEGEYKDGCICKECISAICDIIL